MPYLNDILAKSDRIYMSKHISIWKKINFIRYLLLLIGVGIMLGFFSAFIKLVFGTVPPFIGGGIVGGGMVVAIFTINRLIAEGKCVWLLKES